MLQSLWSQVKRSRHWKNGCKSKKQVINFPADKIHIISALTKPKSYARKLSSVPRQNGPNLVVVDGKIVKA